MGQRRLIRSHLSTQLAWNACKQGKFFATCPGAIASMHMGHVSTEQLVLELALVELPLMLSFVGVVAELLLGRSRSVAKGALAAALELTS